MKCEQFDELLAFAGGRCQICRVSGEETPHGALHIDHDASVGMHGVRGLLCSRCNTLLGRSGLLTGQAVDVYLANPWHVGRLVRSTHWLAKS
jgi:hypothetical protein